MAKKTQTERQRLRNFGFVMAVAFGALGGFLLWRQRPAGPYVLDIAAAFLICGLAFPKLLAPIEKAWMALARVLQTVVTGLILVLTFFLVITPMGLLLRLSGKDLLAMRLDRNATTFWEPMEPDGPQTRPDKPY